MIPDCIHNITVSSDKGHIPTARGQDIRSRFLWPHWPPYTHPLTKLPRGSDGALPPRPTSPEPGQSISSGGLSQSMGVDVLFFQGLCLLLSIVLTKSYHWYTVTSWLVQPPWNPKQFETHW